MASKQKVVSGLLLGLGVVGLLVLVGYVPLAIEFVVAIMVTIGAFELSRMSLKKEGRLSKSALAIQTLSTLAFYIVLRIITTHTGEIKTYALMTVIVQIVIAGVLLNMKPRHDKFIDPLLTLPGIMWIGLVPIAIPLIAEHSNSIFYLTPMLVSAVFADTGADLGGSMWKKKGWKTHAFAPTISPKKTWEGAIAGFLAAILMTAVAWTVLSALKLQPEDVSALHILPLGIIGGTFGPLGDLIESWFKRYYGVKDSGNLIPGHGGILDRVDGIIFVGPPFLLYITQVIQ